jgi:hypothetical protein
LQSAGYTDANPYIQPYCDCYANPYEYPDPGNCHADFYPDAGTYAYACPHS